MFAWVTSTLLLSLNQPANLCSTTWDLQVGWGTKAELKITHANIIDHTPYTTVVYKFDYVQVVVTNSNSSPSTYLQNSVLG